MKQKQILSMLFLAAAMMALNAAPTAAQSVGGTQSERAGDSDTPVPPQGKPGDVKARKSGQAATAQNKDTSVGGTQSRRAGDSDTPLPPQGTPGDATKYKSGSRSESRRAGLESSHMNSQQEVRLAQEALKNQGHDPGPIDGIMGAHTREALREFQSANGLRQTGMLDAQTKQKLNIESSSSSESAAPMSK
jgi:peptidoglycan hydrolase-like protein with peptidoglycan-binding domain